MQKVNLPIILDPLRAAQKRQDYFGIYLASKAVRLAESVFRIEGDVETELSFSLDKQNLTLIKGRASAKVILICQRCGKGFNYTVTANFKHCPALASRQESIPEEYEAVEIDSFGEIDLLSMVEDELILSLPIVAMHETEHCSVFETDRVFGKLPDELEKPNPFAILAGLQKKESEE